MRVHRFLIAVGSIATLVPVALAAQSPSDSPSERAGFYGSLGAGYGASLFQGSNTQNPTSGTGMYTLTLGYMLSPAWRLGAEVDYVAEPGGSGNSTAVYYSASVAYYHDASTHLWFKGNLGYSTYTATYFTENNPGGGGGAPVPVSNNGIAAGLGIGYDLPLGKKGVIMAPFLSYERQLSESAIPQIPGASARGSFLFAGLGIGFNR